VLTWVVYDISADKTRNRIAKRCLDFGSTSPTTAAAALISAVPYQLWIAGVAGSATFPGGYARPSRRSDRPEGCARISAIAAAERETRGSGPGGARQHAAPPTSAPEGESSATCHCSAQSGRRCARAELNDDHRALPVQCIS